MTAEDHNKYLSWAFLASGVFQAGVIGLAGIFVALAFLLGAPSPSDGLDVLILGIMAAVLSFNLLLTVPNFVAYYAISRKKPWARVSGIVAAAFGLMNMPLGTLAGAYSIWFFSGDTWKSVYHGQNGLTGEYRGQLEARPLSGDRAPAEDPAYTYYTPPPPDWR